MLMFPAVFCVLLLCNGHITQEIDNWPFQMCCWELDFLMIVPVVICANTMHNRVFASLFLLAQSDEFGCSLGEFKKVISRTQYSKCITMLF